MIAEFRVQNSRANEIGSAEILNTELPEIDRILLDKF